MTLVATSPVLGHDTGDTLTVGDDMQAWLIASGYAKDTANTDDIDPSFGVALPDNPTTPGWSEGSDSADAADVTNESITITEGGSGLTSYVLHLAGVNSGSILAAATAAQVQAAMEAMSNIGAGNVLVTGANGGPYTAAFRAGLADVNVAAITATPTGGTGTVTIAVVTAGGTVT